MAIDMRLSCKFSLKPILVGGFNPSEKILVSWDYYSQYIETKKHTNQNPLNRC